MLSAAIDSGAAASLAAVADCDLQEKEIMSESSDTDAAVPAEPIFIHRQDERPLHKKINWFHAILLTSTPIIAIYGLITQPFHLTTLLFTLVYYFFTGMGITAGYHRYWSHRSFSASRPLAAFLAVTGAGAVQGSIKWWCRGHRAHHRYTDSNKDPYSAERGMLWAHLGWLYMKPDPRDFGRVDIEDLKRDPIVAWQHKNYIWLAFLSAFVFPTLFCGLVLDDWAGGFFFGAVLRQVILHHSTFCVNSLAHWLGHSTYDDRHSPRDHIFTAFVTLGEGFHNFHHEFPNDYRNAIRFYQYDPTKWFVRGLSWVGLSYDLKKFDENEIQKGRILMEEKKLEQRRARLDWGKPIDKLPQWSMEEYVREVKENGNEFVLISNVIYDVSSFMDDHPGGRSMLKIYLGRDATHAFNGGIYDHNNSARNLLAQFRIAKIAGATNRDSMGRGAFSASKSKRLYAEVSADSGDDETIGHKAKHV